MIANLMIVVLNAKFAGFVEGIKNNFSDLEYDYHEVEKAI